MGTLPPFRRERKPIRDNGDNLVTSRQLSPERPLLQIVSPNVDGLKLAEWVPGNVQTIEPWLSENGAVLFRGFEIKNIEEFQDLVAVLVGNILEYRERSSPRSRVSGNVYTSTDYPAHQRIFFHNENSYQQQWPLRIAFYCVVAPTEKGETPISDTRKVHARIPERIRERFTQLGVLYVRNFRNVLGYSWQEAFQTDDHTEVERYCRSAGIEYEWSSGDRLTTKACRPAVAAHPLTGETVWFNHAAFFHSSGLDADVRYELLTEFGESALPNQTYYGDGSPIDPNDAETIRDAYRLESVKFSWHAGDVLLLDNMLTAHAREPFSGPRRILVAMGRPYSCGT